MDASLTLKAHGEWERTICVLTLHYPRARRYIASHPMIGSLEPMLSVTLKAGEDDAESSMMNWSGPIGIANIGTFPICVRPRPGGAALPGKALLHHRIVFPGVDPFPTENAHTHTEATAVHFVSSCCASNLAADSPSTASSPTMLRSTSSPVSGATSSNSSTATSSNSSTTSSSNSSSPSPLSSPPLGLGLGLGR